MKITDISFDRNIMNLLQQLIGKKFKKYKCDPFIYTPSVYGVVGLYIGGKIYKLTSLLHPEYRFFSEEDVAVLQISESSDDQVVSMQDDGEMIDSPVDEIIQSVVIVNDEETVTYNGNKNTFVSTKGIIFKLNGGNEISFEIDTWFSEFITIRKGYHLLDQFTQTQEFLDEWDESAGYEPSVSRKIVTLS